MPNGGKKCGAFPNAPKQDINLKGLKPKEITKMDNVDKKILKMLDLNARTELADIAAVADISEEEAAGRIAELEKAGVICGYKAVIDWEKVDTDSVSAIIELKVTPKAGLGFEEVAERIAKYPAVESVSLMSGACDLTVVVTGKTFQEVSAFVAKELANALKGNVESSFSKKVAGGFTIGPKDGGYFISFTDETFNALISEYLRPATKKLLFG